MKNFIFLLSILLLSSFTSLNAQQNKRWVLNWDIKVEEILPLTYLISFQAEIPDSSAVFAINSVGPIPVSVYFPETSCFEIIDSLKELTIPIINKAVSEAFRQEIKVHTKNIHLTLKIKQTKPRCIKTIKEGYIEYMVLFNENVFYPPTSFDFKLKL